MDSKLSERLHSPKISKSHLGCILQDGKTPWRFKMLETPAPIDIKDWVPTSDGLVLVSTIDVEDRDYCYYETAISINNQIGIMETYERLEAAQRGHMKWVKFAKQHGYSSLDY
jgi:hypothetical protein